MRIRMVQMIIASLALLIYGCSKRTPPAAWSSSESVMVEPGIGIGPVHSGMTMRQVMTALGQPANGVVPNAPDEGVWFIQISGLEFGSTLEEEWLVSVSDSRSPGTPKKALA
jgi:hypothetical protein